jgi:hypothetical protein
MYCTLTLRKRVQYAPNYILLQATMNPLGEPSTAKGRGRVIWRQGQEHKELRCPQAENRTGMQTLN